MPHPLEHLESLARALMRANAAHQHRHLAAVALSAGLAAQARQALDCRTCDNTGYVRWEEGAGERSAPCPACACHTCGGRGVVLHEGETEDCPECAPARSAA